MTTTRRLSRLAAEIKQTRPFASPAQEATVALLRTADHVRRHLTRVVADEALTLQQYNVLRILRGAGDQPLSAFEIGERLIEETPGVSRLVDRLVRKGLVRRDRSATDRRLLECYITPRGMELLSRLDAPVERADRDALKGLSASELDRLDALLARVRQAAE